MIDLSPDSSLYVVNMVSFYSNMVFGQLTVNHYGWWLIPELWL
jgi:hypothetical protein